MEITEKEYWENFWSGIKLPLKVDMYFSNDRNIAHILDKYLTENNSNVIEIGCAPGKWLVYMVEKFGSKVEGIEYLESAAQKTRENLELNKVTGNVYTVDFFKFVPQRKYDVVLSLGFIEHFKNQEEIIQKHFELLTNEGILVLGIPRLTGINYHVSKMVDKYSENKLIPSHNLDIMNIEYFSRIPDKFKCKSLFYGYVGSFEPALFETSNLPFIKKFVFRAVTLLSKLLPQEISSSYIMGVYKCEMLR